MEDNHNPKFIMENLASKTGQGTYTYSGSQPYHGVRSTGNGNNYAYDAGRSDHSPHNMTGRTVDGTTYTLAYVQDVCGLRWKIEQFHRETKQLTGLEGCQIRRARIIRNHVVKVWLTTILLLLTLNQRAGSILPLWNSSLT